MNILSKMYRSTGCVIIHDEYVVMDAQGLRKCAYPRSIYGHICIGVKEVLLFTMNMWSWM